MYRVSIETQRKIMYIPFVNIVNLFIWLWNSFGIHIPYGGVPQTFFIMIKNAVPLLAVQIAVSYFSTAVSGIIGTLNGYLIPLLIGRDLIKFQEKLEHENA